MKTLDDSALDLTALAEAVGVLKPAPSRGLGTHIDFLSGMTMGCLFLTIVEKGLFA